MLCVWILLLTFPSTANGMFSLLPVLKVSSGPIVLIHGPHDLPHLFSLYSKYKEETTEEEASESSEPDVCHQIR